ncbi:MAG: FtsW/RodA/SpoVE family cell cycle protein [Phycisphaeraceae bacterium]|nr:FtsW/RodA/SpoVE family cell cycle protein [Phycisphaeraceae bacterium]
MNPLTAKLTDLLRPHAGWFVLLAAVGLTVVGITAISTVDLQHARAQAQWLAIALTLMLICLLPHPKFIGQIAGPLAVVITLVLAIMILPGVPRSIVPVRNGARAWIDLRFMMLQPSELAKIIYVLTLAWYLRHRQSYRTFRGLLVPFLILFVPMTLVLLQPDMGTAILFIPALLAMLLAAGARLRHLGSIIGLGVLTIGLNVAAIYTLPDSMQLLQSHQVARIRATISRAKGETRYLKDVGFQQDKAVTLIGAGGPDGLGEEKARTLIAYNRLPEDHNDMIFAVVVSRWGFLGGAGVLALYGILIMAMLRVAARTKEPITRLSVVGFASLLLSQVTINIGMSLGILPIIGITLPFVSYGGSSLLASFAMIGLVMNFASQRPSIIQRPSFEFDHADALFQ